MASKEQTDSPSDEQGSSSEPAVERAENAAEAVRAAAESIEAEDIAFDAAAAHLGTAKYVQGAFFIGGVLVAFLAGKLLAALWNALAEWPAAVSQLPGLLRFAEDERTSVTMPVGALIGIAAVVYAARRADIRSWAEDVATELYKVHWPEREVVTTGTVVVLVAGAFATLYVGLLDRVWGFITNLVYGV